MPLLNNAIISLHQHSVIQNLLAIALLLLATVALWRLYRFTIYPYFCPDDPEELPYWIPYIGHARHFFKDFNGVLESGRRYFKDTKKPYSICVAGTRIYVVTAPSDVADLDRNTTTLSYHDTIKEMYKSVGVTQETIKKLFVMDANAPYNTDALRPMLGVSMLTEYHRQQALPGKRLNEILTDSMIPYMTSALDVNEFHNHSSILSSSEEVIEISLLDLCNRLFVGSTVEAFLGRSVWKTNPNLIESLRLWERTNWKFMYQVPAVFSRDMITARDDIIQTFVKYLQAPSTDRQDSGHFARVAENMLRQLECSELDIAKIFLLHFWAILGNVYKVAFWTMAFLAYDSDLLQVIRQEVAPSIHDDRIEEEKLIESCPKLQSVINEVLRLSITTGLVRDIVKPTLVQGKILRPGNKLMVPFRQLHLNRDVWGQEPYTMDPLRFETNPKLINSKSYRPFGGGHTLCPGRFFARRSISFAVALLISRFDMSVKLGDGGEDKKNGVFSVPSFPKMDTMKPSPGASLPYKGQDAIVILKKLPRPNMGSTGNCSYNRNG